MSLHVIVGAGPVGTSVARLLAADGEQVRIITRRGAGPTHPLVERVAADASDADRLRELTAGAVALYNCANPPYDQWPTAWPPLSRAMIGAAQATGAVLAITGNLYGYGPVHGPMTEDLPLAATGRKGRVRAKMWHDALAAGVPTFEVRASDYIGPGAASVITNYLLPAAAARRTLRIPADIDLPHSFTYTGDVARALVTMARDERAWGRPWHVPSNPPLTIRELTRRFFEVTGQAPVKVVGMPRWLPRAAGLFSSMVREFNEMDYQFYAPFELDTSAATRTFGLRPTPLDDALRAAVPVPA